MNQPKSAPIVRLSLVALALLTFATAPLQAEDVIVTSCVGDQLRPCDQSCIYGLDTQGYYDTVSTAIPPGADRTRTVYGSGTNATWDVTPPLGTSAGVYRVYVSQGATYNCSADLHIKIVATANCTLANLNYVGQTQIDTTAFQEGASLNVWTPVAIITNSSKTPTITFSYASGSSSRWYMDEVWFENIAAGATAPARITAIHYGSSLTIGGTGPASRPFALVSATNAGTPLNQWAPEQTNADGTGSFTFNVTPGAPAARFFRVITQ
jgi:hypothetical protein